MTFPIDIGAVPGIHCLRPPVIITGMHRSGTTLVARCLQAMGLFLGAQLQEDEEALFFLAVNEELFRRVHASWDNPSPVAWLTERPDAMRTLLQSLRADLRSAAIRSYLGLRRYARYRSLERLDQPWGWKDPRTVFTLPLWGELFPDAKIIYMVRHGVDVAQSLTRRATEKVQEWAGKHESRVRQRGGRSALQRAAFQGSTRCFALERSFGLWEEYVARAEETLAGMKQDRLVVKYEALLRRPQGSLAELAAFCGLPAPDDALMRRMTATVDPTRAYAFLSSPALKEYAARVEATRWMSYYGYSADEQPVGGR